MGRRIAHYQKLGLPVEADHFVENLRGRMTAALYEFNRILPRQSHLRIYCPNKSRPDRGLFAVAKLERQKEPKSLDLIKDGIVKDFGMLDLLDIFVEADRLVDFTRFFTHSGTKEVRSREALRPLLILDLFAEGTNMRIKRLANSNDRYSYEELLYVRKMYFSPEALRNANAAVVNKVLEIRNPRIWGEGHACASDGKRFPSWSQNLMSEWRSRYHGDGVLVYWHVETGAVCIYQGNQADSCKFIRSLDRFVLVSSYHCFSIRNWLVLCAAASHRVGSSRDAQHALRFALPLGYSFANSPIACLALDS